MHHLNIVHWKLRRSNYAVSLHLYTYLTTYISMCLLSLPVGAENVYTLYYIKGPVGFYCPSFYFFLLFGLIEINNRNSMYFGGGSF